MGIRTLEKLAVLQKQSSSRTQPVRVPVTSARMFRKAIWEKQENEEGAAWGWREGAAEPTACLEKGAALSWPREECLVCAHRTFEA